MTNQPKPSDLINDEIRDLRGTRPELAPILWELMKQFSLEEIKQEIDKLKAIKEYLVLAEGRLNPEKAKQLAEIKAKYNLTDQDIYSIYDQYR